MGLGTTAVGNVIRTSTAAETFNGGYIDGTCNVTSSQAWMLVLFYLKDGQAVPTLSITTGSGPKPESSVLWWKIFTSSTGALPLMDGGPVKIVTKRKMMPGDTIQWLGLTTATSGVAVYANFTLFFKQ